MKTIMVRYKTAEAHADTNETLIRAVFTELRAQAPAGVRYATYRLADRVTFIHIATVAAVNDNPLTSLPAFTAFQSKLGERCVEQPVLTELPPLESYGSQP